MNFNNSMLSIRYRHKFNAAPSIFYKFIAIVMYTLSYFIILQFIALKSK